ncbi:RNA-binding S4 domain-containing protein [Snodgrassella sp. CFCC 13594]|uniref:RNA-binding S4 domain-containing protein n=1 Tax=Snodgrassella sp. CFCC 13594 TaxID=1775559 RepID=UPI00083547C6|nr:RNA-binding S4 domain-containing protein [Snodgrassella sp. CFCC 13594]
MKQAFYLDGHEYVALCDLLKLAGVVDSGGRAKHVIGDGAVSRNGVVETRKTAKIHAGEIIALGDVIIEVCSGSHE